MKNLNKFPRLLLLSLSLGFSALTFTSCDKEDVVPTLPGTPATGNPSPAPTPAPVPNTPPPVTANSLLVQMGTRNMQYDLQGRLAALSYADQQWHGYTIVYSGNKPARLDFNGGGYLLYTYEGDKVVAANRYYGENQVNYRYTFEYANDILVKQKQWSYATSSGGFLTVNEYKYDGHGNLVELIVFGAESGKEADLVKSHTITWGQFDDKPNPMPYAESSIYLPGVKLFVNNPGYRNTSSAKELYTYTYHASGMPKQRLAKVQGYEHVPAFTENYTYR